MQALLELGISATNAKCRIPTRSTTTFTEDGGAWYHVGELESSAPFGIDTVTGMNKNHSVIKCKSALYTVDSDHKQSILLKDCRYFDRQSSFVSLGS